MIGRTKLKTEDWITQRLVMEGGASFWTDSERADLADQLARKYRPGEGNWHVRRDHQMMEEGLHEVYTVTRGALDIHTEAREEAAKAVARVLQNLDRTLEESQRK